LNPAQTQTPPDPLRAFKGERGTRGGKLEKESFPEIRREG